MRDIAVYQSVYALLIKNRSTVDCQTCTYSPSPSATKLVNMHAPKVHTTEAAL